MRGKVAKALRSEAYNRSIGRDHAFFRRLLRGMKHGYADFRHPVITSRPVRGGFFKSRTGGHCGRMPSNPARPFRNKLIFGYMV